MCIARRPFWLGLLACVLILPSTGCSLLGLSPLPVAHLMTRQTKNVLADSPQIPGVPRELAKQVRETHFLQPGDELLVETLDLAVELNQLEASTDQSQAELRDRFDQIRLPADQTVFADGTIDLGKFGRLKVAGLTLESAEDSIQRIIFDVERLPVQVNVRLINAVHSFYVIGEVNSPGAYPLTGHETVLDGILEAGGLTGRASACDILLARPTNPCDCRVTLPVCYRSITQLGDTTTNYHLKPGDRIFVARQSLQEELIGYVAGARTCDRCCRSQKACKTPIETLLQDFEHASGSWIPPVPPPTTANANAQPEVNSPRLDSAPNHLLPPAASPRPVPSSSIDGELDFGDG